MAALTLEVRSDRVAVLTIDQPGRKANVLTQELWEELEARIASLAARSDLAGLVLASGKPGVFIAGADLKLFQNASGPNDPAVRAFLDLGQRVLFALEALPFPTCAAIDGAALGGGLEVALACRFRICGSHPKIQIGLPEVNFGLIPGWGGTQRLRRLAGEIVANLLIATGLPLTADRAEQNSVVSKLVPSEQLLEAAVEMVLAKPPIIEGVTQAVQEFLQLQERTYRVGLREAIAMETESFMKLAGSEESKRKISEFFATRGK